jgi:hypothetical protein
VSIGVLITYVKPRYDNLKSLRSDITAFNDNLDTANKLKESREALIAKYNAIPKEDLDNLKTLLPDNVDNIRLVIQIDSLATKNGLSTVRNISYQASDLASSQSQDPSQNPDAQKPYGSFVISFETTGQYQNFLSFLSDLEENLRLVDVTGIEFTPNQLIPGIAANIGYKVTLTTYWLKQ